MHTELYLWKTLRLIKFLLKTKCFKKQQKNNNSEKHVSQEIVKFL